MDVSEKFCPDCKKKNGSESNRCAYCGASLEDCFIDPGTRTETTDMLLDDTQKVIDWFIDETVVPDSGIAVYVEGGFHPAYIDSRPEFVLGRKMGTTTEPLLDLSTLGGYESGLSRRHAVVRRSGYGYEVLDLGSVNGTWLNDERLIPHKPYPLASGSHLRLGRMRLFVLYRPIAETEPKP